MERRITSIGIHLGDSECCLQLLAGRAAIYLHGTTDEIRAFGREILDAADAYDLEQARATQDASAAAAEVTDSEFARVCWRNPLAGSTGYGIALPIAIAKEELHRASESHPKLEHWLELVDTATEPASEVKA